MTDHAYTVWRIYRRADGTRVHLRGPMDEDHCRRYVSHFPAKFRLVRVDVVEEHTEVPVEPAPPSAPRPARRRSGARLRRTE
jgi:hypothetical protein